MSEYTKLRLLAEGVHPMFKAKGTAVGNTLDMQQRLNWLRTLDFTFGEEEERLVVKLVCMLSEQTAISASAAIVYVTEDIAKALNNGWRSYHAVRFTYRRFKERHGLEEREIMR